MSSRLTQEMIDAKIEECCWKHENFNEVCCGVAAPCASVVRMGRCPMLREILRNQMKEAVHGI